jgi:hypothetical protein
VVLVFNKPDQYKWTAMISLVAVMVAVSRPSEYGHRGEFASTRMTFQRDEERLQLHEIKAVEPESREGEPLHRPGTLRHGESALDR